MIIQGNEEENQNAIHFGYGNSVKGSTLFISKWVGIMAGSDFVPDTDDMPFADDDANWLFHEMFYMRHNIAYVIQGTAETGYSPRLPYKAYLSGQTDDSNYIWLLDVLNDRTGFGDQVFLWVATHGGLVNHQPLIGEDWRYGLRFGTSRHKYIFFGLFGNYWTNRVEASVIRSKLLELTGNGAGCQKVFYWMDNCEGATIFDKMTSAGNIGGLLTWYRNLAAHQYMYDYLYNEKEFEFETFETYKSTRPLNGDTSIFDAVSETAAEVPFGDFSMSEDDQLPFGDYWL